MLKLQWPILFLLIACASPTKETPTEVASAPKVVSPDCIVKRAAFDIGSGQTRLKVAKVDKCELKILEVLLELKEPVSYRETMNTRGKLKYLASPTMQQGYQVLKKLKLEAQKFSPDEYQAVATAVFRETRNATTFIANVNRDLKINARIISQEEESAIGYYSALVKTSYPDKNILVWDIGGSSMQLVTKDDNNSFITYQGELASIPFKNRVLKEIKNQTSGVSPNPLTTEELKKAENISYAYALNDMSADFLQKIKTNQDFKVLGIGGVLYYSVLKQSNVETNSLDLSDIEKTLSLVANKKDSDYEDPSFVETNVTNVALVSGFMRALEIKKIEIYDASLTEGVLVHPKLWKN